MFIKTIGLFLLFYSGTVCAQQKSTRTITLEGKTYYLHTVEKDQSLKDIAALYGVSVNDLLKENPEAFDEIKAGQELKVLLKNTETPAAPVDVSAPPDTIKNDVPSEKPQIIFSGYVDAYYAYYTDSVGHGNYHKFPSVAPRSDLGLNAVMLSAQYEGEKVRGVVTLHYGDIAKSTWSGAYNNIMEARAGVRIFKKLWVDAGFFRTHVGAEGLFPKENFASSVAVPTFYEPYFESGVRLNYNPNERLAINIFLLNGYNMFEDNNEKKSTGALITYALGDKGNIGYNNYIGDDTPLAGDSISHLRIYQNVFLNYTIKKLKLQLGVDHAMQENSAISDSSKSASMYSGLLSLKFQAGKKLFIYSRGELFNDPDGFLSGVFMDKANKLTGQKLWGATLGIECKPTENSYVRVEGRQLQMDKNQEIFQYNGANSSGRLEIIACMGVSF